MNQPIGKNADQSGDTILLKNRGRTPEKEKTVRFASKIDMIDSLKAEIKGTRQRIDTIANGQ